MSVRNIDFDRIFTPGKCQLDCWGSPYPRLHLVFDLSHSMEPYREKLVEDVKYVFTEYMRHKKLHPGNFNIGLRFFSNDMEYPQCTFDRGDVLNTIYPERISFEGRSAIMYNVYGLLSGYHSGSVGYESVTPGLRRDVIIWTDGHDNASIETYRNKQLLSDVIAERKKDNVHVHWAIANLDEIEFKDDFDKYESNPRKLGAAGLLQDFFLSSNFLYALQLETRQFPRGQNFPSSDWGEGEGFKPPEEDDWDVF